MRQVGPHDVVPFRAERNATLDTLRWAKKRLTVTSLLEVDVTAARQAIRAHRSRTGAGLSFTAWVVACVARAAAEHPRVHAVRRGARHLVLFHEVDVAVLIERAVAGAAEGETLPMPYVVRRANEKSPSEIHEEIAGRRPRHSRRDRPPSRRARRRRSRPCSSGCRRGSATWRSGADCSAARNGSRAPWGRWW